MPAITPYSLFMGTNINANASTPVLVLASIHTDPSASTGVDVFSSDKKYVRLLKSDIPYWLGGILAALGALFQHRLGFAVALSGVAITLAKIGYDYKHI